MHNTTRSPWLLRIVGMWVLVGLLLAFFDRAIWDAIWILALGLWPLFALAGLMLLVAAVLRARTGDHSVAFPQPGGIIDNWEGVIYDPTGAVAEATGWRNGGAGQFTAPAKVRVLFGGDLVGCEPIEAAFYRCWFT